LAEQELLGRERSLIYRTMVLTGLREGTMARITVGQATLEGRTPHLEFLARTVSKNSMSSGWCSARYSRSPYPEGNALTRTLCDLPGHLGLQRRHATVTLTPRCGSAATGINC
jgi:hypothetical protein